MGEIGELAQQLAAGERTLRRSVESGLIRASRDGPRRLSIPAAERRYLHDHWPDLSRLRRALRTERNVRLAVLFGSFARGTDVPGSDIDLLVSLRDERISTAADLAERLSRAVGRTVQVVRLGQAKRSARFLLQVLEDGRVLIDREGEWPRVQDGAAALRRRAERERAELGREAAKALELVARG